MMPRNRCTGCVLQDSLYIEKHNANEVLRYSAEQDPMRPDSFVLVRSRSEIICGPQLSSVATWFEHLMTYIFIMAVQERRAVGER